MADERIIEVYSDTRTGATCPGERCGAAVTWAEVVMSGLRMCFTGEPVARRSRYDATGRLVEALSWDDNHWATCPDRDVLRSGRS